ncbi:MAG: hypothetical protein KDD47_16015, partial [Acidobacteria bacterium]|nr:hypothetical protein [Acidobacteriota bacterium]
MTLAATAPQSSPDSFPRVREATAADDREIRAFLAERPMDGVLRIALTRDPCFEAAAAAEGIRHHTVVARHRDGSLLGFGSRAVRPVYLAAKPVLMGYLAQLRTGDRVPSIRRWREAFDWLRRTHRPDELAFDLTAIAEDNRPARRLLEAGLAGFPVYHRLTEVATLVFPTSRRRRRSPPALPVVPEQRDEFLSLLRRALEPLPLATAWRQEDFAPS